MRLFIRIRLAYDVFAPATLDFERVCSKLVIYEHFHNVNNIHIHIYMEDVTCSTDTLKNYIKKVVATGKGNDFWSFKSAEDDGCITYMTKGTLEPSFVKGYTPEEIETYKGKWEVRNPTRKTLVSYSVKENPAEQKRRQWDNIEEIVKRYNQLEIKTGRGLCRLIKQVVITENHTMLGRHKLRDYYDTIKAIVNEHDWSLSAVQFCEKDYF